MFKSACLGGASALALVASLCASSATAADPAATEATAVASVAEITVVAEKREAKLESVPVAVTAFTGQQRGLIGIESVQDLSDFTPGLSFTSIDDRPYIRGVGRNTDNLTTASAVAVYYNGVYYGANAAIILQKDNLFIGNIEVDRGPQNALHGSNADGGTINYISNRPTDHFYAEARAGAASHGEYFGEALVSGPISDNVRFRLGGNYTSMTGGYFNNLNGPPQGGDIALGNGGQSHYLEAQLDANVGHLDVWAMASSGEFNANYHTVATLGTIPDNLFIRGAFVPSGFYGLCGLPGVPATPGGAGCAGGPQVTSVTTDPVTANRFAGNNPANLNPRDFIQEFTSTNDLRDDIALATNWTYHFPSFDLSWIGGFQSFDYELNYTSGASSGVRSYTLAAPASTGFLCGAAALGGAFGLAGCTRPLRINPAPNTTYFAEKDQFFSNEVNLTSTGRGPLQYLAGLYWYHEHFNQPVNSEVEPGQTQLAHPFYVGACPGGALLCAAPANPSSAESTSNTELTYDNVAAFGQVSYKLSDQWKLTGALRYTSDHKSGLQSWRFVVFDGPPALGLGAFGSAGFGANTPALDLTKSAVGAAASTAYPGAGPASLNPATGAYERALSVNWGALTGEAVVDWTPSRDLLVYGKYSRGYKAGGFSTYTIAANPLTNPEYVDAFEIGAKKTIGSIFTLNAAAFYYDYAGDQVPLTVANTQGLLSPVLYNLATAHNYGIEIESVWRPIDPLTLSLAYSWLQATVGSTGGQCIEDTVDPGATQPGAHPCPAAQQTAPGVVVQNIVGQHLPEAPPNKVAFNALYTFTFDPGKLTLSGTAIWKDVTYASVFNRPYTKQPPYAQVNLHATWSDAKDRYNVILFCDNLFDTLGYDAAGGTLLAPGDIVYGPSLTAPRTFGVQFQYRFK